MLPETLQQLIDSVFREDGVPVQTKVEIWAQAVELGKALGVEVKAPDWRSPGGVSAFWWRPAALLRITRSDWEECCHKYAADCALHAFPFLLETYGGPDNGSEERFCLKVLQDVASGGVSDELRETFAEGRPDSSGWWVILTSRVVVKHPVLASIRASAHAADNRTSEKIWQSNRLMAYAWGCE
jgi:hypothetical protein